jgi:hypothetical protein
MNWMMAGALIAAVWVCLPDMLFLLGLTRVRRGILGGPEAVRSGPGEVVTDEIAEQLDALGFVPAGLYWEQLPAHKLFRHPVFVSRKGDCFASVYRLFNNDSTRVAFKTAFADGAAVYTQNYNGGMEADEGSLRTGGLNSGETAIFGNRAPLADVLEEHRQRVRRFVLAGHPILSAFLVEDYVETVRTYSDHPSIKRKFGNNIAVLFWVKLAFLMTIPSLFAAFWGSQHAGIWPILLAESVTVLLIRYYGAPLLSALDKISRILPADESP